MKGYTGVLMATLSLIPLDPEGYLPNGGDLPGAELKKEEARDEEERKTWFRNARIYENEGAWFFATREKIDVGPYTSLKEAEIDVQVLIASLKNTESEEEAIQVIQEFNNRERLRLL